jgi:lysophospholipase L1-like esterase
MRSTTAAVLGAVAAVAALSACTSPQAAPRSAASASPSVSSAPTVSSSAGPAAQTSTSSDGAMSMVVIGDSIPFNSPDDCPGCTGFVDRYATAVSTATGRKVAVRNRSQHNGLTLPMLLDELDSFRSDLSGADVIVVAIAHNSNELNSDTPCGAPLGADNQPDWAKLTTACATTSAESYRERFEQLYTRIAGWRAGKPTVLRTINRYDDWRGAPGITLSAQQLATVTTFITTWNTMLCSAAAKASFVCVDVSRAFNGPDGTTPSGQLLGKDYTHPSEKGNALIAETLQSVGFAPLA